MSRAWGFPSEKTTWVRVRDRGHRRQARASFRSGFVILPDGSGPALRVSPELSDLLALPAVPGEGQGLVPGQLPQEELGPRRAPPVGGGNGPPGRMRDPGPVTFRPGEGG